MVERKISKAKDIISKVFAIVPVKGVAITRSNCAQLFM